ncbi:DsbA family protein [Mumia sp. ZJ1417]|uniref:DsbA family protein n=1 Tax=unclassified Mumia TaxID=2621872 RepID=UPI001423387B|nr:MULTISPECIES: DsbA family protein [unclassified Mumia]QMW67682.1 DsbA family protein [Mumia sp. ZJ1417]
MSTLARDKSRQMRAARAAELARKTRQRKVAKIVGILVILGLMAAIAIAVGRSLASDDSGDVTGKVVVPANVETGAFSVGDTDAPVTLDLYYDYMCPACGAFESTNAEDLSRLIDQGTIRVNLHVMAFLDEQSQGTEYSTRAGNAYAAVVDAAPDRVWAFHNGLYANQPHEGTEGLNDDQIASIALRAGVPADVVENFTEGVHRGWVAQSTQEAFDAGVTSTPTVKLNGDMFTGDWSAPDELTKAIETAAASGLR